MERKNTAVARRTMAGPEGTSHIAEIITPATDVAVPMRKEYKVKVMRLCVS